MTNPEPEVEPQLDSEVESGGDALDGFIQKKKNELRVEILRHLMKGLPTFLKHNEPKICARMCFPDVQGINFSAAGVQIIPEPGSLLARMGVTEINFVVGGARIDKLPHCDFVLYIGFFRGNTHLGFMTDGGDPCFSEEMMGGYTSFPNSSIQKERCFDLTDWREIGRGLETAFSWP